MTEIVTMKLGPRRELGWDEDLPEGGTRHLVGWDPEMEGDFEEDLALRQQLVAT